MRPTTTYGTWCSLVDGFSTSLERTVSESLGPEGEELTAEAIAEEYRARINAALPRGVSLLGDEFVGPIDGPSSEVDIAAIVESVDLEEIIRKYDP